MLTLPNSLLRRLLAVATLAAGGFSLPAAQALADGAALSPTFAKNCSRCHGSEGRGAFGPDLKGKDFSTVEMAVRSGFPQQMPAFNDKLYPVETLRADVLILNTSDPAAPKLEPLRVGTLDDQLASASHDLREEDGPKAILGQFAIEPFVQPYVKCMELEDKDKPGSTKRVCVNAIISGSTDEDYRFADFGVCKDVRTQRPFNANRPPREVVNSPDDPRLKDQKFMQELAWVTAQIRSSGCVCCHDSSIDKRTAVWDIAAKDNPIWTDQLSKYTTEVFTGRVDSTALGAFPASINHGFDRHVTGLPSTDPKRMQRFWLAKAAQLGTTSSDLATMPPLAPILADQLRGRPPMCPPGVGVHSDQTIHWAYIDWFNLGEIFQAAEKKDLSKIFQALPIARYVYILKPDSVAPLVPPNLDRPAGMMWRLDRAREAAPFISGLPTYPTAEFSLLPPMATQAFPEHGELPEPLVEGQTYFVDAQIDMAFPAARCLFKYPAD